MTTHDKSRSAVITIVFTVFALALGDAIIKGVSTNFTLWQIFVLRSVVVISVLVAMLSSKRWGAPVWPKQGGWTILRSLMLTLMWVTYYASLPHISLSVAAAAYYTLPLFITIFAATFLEDTIGQRGWLAIVIGFIGVLMVLQPRIEDFNWYAILPVVSAILYALAMILTRSKCSRENVLVLSLWLNFSMLFVGVLATMLIKSAHVDPQITGSQAFLVGEWSAMGLKEWATIGVLSIAIIIGSVGAAYAYQNGLPATIATFDFAYVAFAVLWGVLMFQEIPGSVAAIGMFMIVFAGILAVRSKVKS